MASKVEFKDYTIQVQNAIDDRINAVLEECAGELESQVKRNSRVRTGKTKNSFRHVVDEENHIATIGSGEENAIWEEFGTGEYALKGNGRKGGWFYEDEKGDGHFTYGKKPSRAFWKAYTSLKAKLINHIQNSLKGL
jgi:hypothetical protein